MTHRWLRVAGLFLLVASLTACAALGSPDIALSESRADLGRVVNGEVREVATKVRNDGTAPLIIEAVTTSCGCTTATVEPMKIPAGDAAVLLVTYDSGAHGPEAVGPVQRQIFITSNDPDEREIIFDIEAGVVLPGD